MVGREDYIKKKKKKKEKHWTFSVNALAQSAVSLRRFAVVFNEHGDTRLYSALVLHARSTLQSTHLCVHRA